MNKQEFLAEIKKGGVPMITRFLGVTPQEAVALIQNNQLEDALAETYDQMPDYELNQFENELKFIGFANKDKTEAASVTPVIAQNGKTPLWAEIRYDHHEVTDGFVVAYIDAWQTSNEDDDEEGVVIAQVVGSINNGKPETFIVYCHPEARFDANAKEAIAAAQKEVTRQLEQINLSGELVIRRTRIDNDSVITVYITQQKPGSKDNKAIVRITTLRSQAGNVPEPVVDHLYPVEMSDAVNQAIHEAIQDLKTEPAYF